MDFNFLNSPEFGAFGGAKFNLAQEKGRLENLETLGKIAAQPGEAALKAAHARAYNATAANAETEAAQNAALGAMAPGAFSGEAGGKGGSLADPFVRLTAIAGSLGMPKKAGEFAKIATEVSLKEQQAATSKSNQELHRLDAQQKQIEQDGSIAYFMTQSPENYAQGRAYLASQGQDISGMPEDYAAARPQLEAIVAQSVKAKDAIAARAKKLVDDANVKKLNAQAGASSASAAAANARVRNLDQIYTFRAKNDGDVSTASAELKRARKAAIPIAAEARADAQASRDRAKFPPPNAKQIADPNLREVGRAYSLPSGVHVWGGVGVGWTPMRAAPVAAPEAEEEDEE